MSVVVYLSTVSSNLEVKKHQQKITMVLDSKKIPYKSIDVSADEGAKSKMRELAGNPGQLPPTICNGDTFCGDYEAFENALEAEELLEFLKMK